MKARQFKLINLLLVILFTSCGEIYPDYESESPLTSIKFISDDTIEYHSLWIVGSKEPVFKVKKIEIIAPDDGDYSMKSNEVSGQVGRIVFNVPLPQNTRVKIYFMDEDGFWDYSCSITKN